MQNAKTDDAATTMGLEYLSRLLERLKIHGLRRACTDEFWDDGNVGGSNPKHLPELFRSLDEAKLCMAALKNVQDHLGKRIRVLRKACTPLVLENGIKTMPDEILSLIFESGHRMTKGCTFAKCVSHVSRRFRQISLRTPLLWSRFSAAYVDTQVQTFLERSGQVCLDVSTMLPYRFAAGKLEAFLKVLQPHSDRWTRLALHSNAEHTMQKIGLTDLPCLQYLFHGSYNNLSGLSSWRLPLLHQISGQHFDVPVGFVFQSQLTSLRLSFRHEVDIAALARALHSAKNLKELTLTLETHTHIVEGSILDPTEMLDEHSVPIDVLQVTIKDLTKYVAAKHLYDALSFLSPSRMEISIGNLVHDDENDERANFLYGSNDRFFPYGSTIYIRISTILDWTGDCAFSFLRHLTRGSTVANTVHIEAPMAAFSWSFGPDDWDGNSVLRHLRFSCCDRLTEQDLACLVTRFVNKQAFTNMESLEIHRCRGISEEFLQDLCEERKIKEMLSWEM